MKEIYRCKKVYDGVTHASKLYPNAYLIMIIIGTMKGNGAGFTRLVERLIRGVWTPTAMEFMQPSLYVFSCVKKCFVKKFVLFSVTPRPLQQLQLYSFQTKRRNLFQHHTPQFTLELSYFSSISSCPPLFLVSTIRSFHSKISPVHCFLEECGIVWRRFLERVRLRKERPKMLKRRTDEGKRTISIFSCSYWIIQLQIKG